MELTLQYNKTENSHINLVCNMSECDKCYKENKSTILDRVAW